MKARKRSSTSPWVYLAEELEVPSGTKERITIVIPSFNSFHSITKTLDSLVAQEYPDKEIIVVDAGSTDRTLELVKRYVFEGVMLYSLAGSRLYEQLNRGISTASGKYVGFLFPGDYYVSKYTLAQVAGELFTEPAIVFSAGLLRGKGQEPKILFRPFSLPFLRTGQQPTSLQSCWFLKDAINGVGRFDPSLDQRGGFDLLCRLCLKKDLESRSLHRVMTDHHRVKITYGKIYQHFYETGLIILRYFGWVALFRWFFVQKDAGRTLALWMRSLKTAVLGP